jgi:hypothetical protein
MTRAALAAEATPLLSILLYIHKKEVLFMPYIAPDVIAEVKKMDLLTYLQNYEPHELVRFSNGVYTTRAHDSLKISNGRWMWHSRGIGGKSALDYLIKVNGMSFTGAVEQIIEQTEIEPPASASSPEEKPKAVFALPPMDNGMADVERYLAGRGISKSLIRYCADLRILYQSRCNGYVNAVFVGYDKSMVPRYATIRGTRGGFKGDVPGSSKQYSFALPIGSGRLHLFESAIDLLSFATLERIKIPNLFDGDLLSLSGVYKPKKNIEESTLPPALTRYLKDHPQIRRVHLHLDNDMAGRLATQAIMATLPKRYAATDEPPPFGKDYNEYLCRRLNLLSLSVKPQARER